MKPAAALFSLLLLTAAPFTHAAEPPRFTVQPCTISWPTTASRSADRAGAILLDTTTGETWFLTTHDDKDARKAEPVWVKVSHVVAADEDPLLCLPAPLRGNYKYTPFPATNTPASTNPPAIK